MVGRVEKRKRGNVHGVTKVRICYNVNTIINSAGGNPRALLKVQDFADRLEKTVKQKLIDEAICSVCKQRDADGIVAECECERERVCGVCTLWEHTEKMNEEGVIKCKSCEAILCYRCHTTKCEDCGEIVCTGCLRKVDCDYRRVCWICQETHEIEGVCDCTKLKRTSKI